jgi:hypothetical protein
MRSRCPGTPQTGRHALELTRRPIRPGFTFLFALQPLATRYCSTRTRSSPQKSGTHPYIPTTLNAPRISATLTDTRRRPLRVRYRHGNRHHEADLPGLQWTITVDHHSGPSQWTTTVDHHSGTLHNSAPWRITGYFGPMADHRKLSCHKLSIVNGVARPSNR